jgi:hypothetical protein
MSETAVPTGIPVPAGSQRQGREHTRPGVYDSPAYAACEDLFTGGADVREICDGDREITGAGDDGLFTLVQLTTAQGRVYGFFPDGEPGSFTQVTPDCTVPLAVTRVLREAAAYTAARGVGDPASRQAAERAASHPGQEN